MTNHTTLDTAITEPPHETGSELELLRFALERSRATFAWKVGGLDAAALRRAFPPSTMTIGGLIKHVARCEDMWTSHDFTGEPTRAPWDSAEAKADADWPWHSAADDSPEQLYALWSAAVQRSRAALEAMLAGGGVDQPSKYVFKGQSPNLRRVLVDMHDEYARHVGHADLMRETIDGLVGEDPPQQS